MKVDRATSSNRPSANRAPARAKGGFKPNAAPSTPTASENAPVTAARTLSALLALQGDQHHARDEDVKKAVEHAHQDLDLLATLQHNILTGTIDPATLEKLASSLKASQAATTDPEIVALQQQIGLRIAVEIAKLETGQTKANTFDQKREGNP